VSGHNTTGRSGYLDTCLSANSMTGRFEKSLLDNNSVIKCKLSERIEITIRSPSAEPKTNLQATLDEALQIGAGRGERDACPELVEGY